MKLLYKSHIYESIDTNPLKGGIGDEKIPNLTELVKGVIVEREHVGDLNNPKNLAIAIDIASDHLAESPEYYQALEKMEDELGID